MPDPKPRTLWLAADMPPVQGGVATGNAGLLRQVAADPRGDLVLVPAATGDDLRRELTAGLGDGLLLVPDGTDFPGAALDAIGRHRPDQVVLMRTSRKERDVLSLCRRRGITSLAYVHELSSLPTSWPRVLRWRRRNRLHLASLVAANSRFVARRLEQYGHRPPELVVLQQGVDPPPECAENPAAERAALRRELGLPEHGFVILAASRLVAWKRIHLVLAGSGALLQADPGALLVVLGDGPERAALERQARDLGIADRVRFPGYRPDVHRFMAAADVHVLLSDQEPAGRVFAEAGRLGTPSIACASGGAPEYVADGEGGIVLADGPDLVPALSRELLRLAADPAEVTRLATGARRFAATLTWDRILARYREVLAGATPKAAG